MASYDKNTRLVFALASGANVAQAARKSGCSAKTVFRRLKDDAFRHEVARARGQILSRATAMLVRSSTSAVRTLRGLLKDGDAGVRRAAAKTMLDSLVRMSEQADVEERLANLETSLAEDS